MVRIKKILLTIFFILIIIGVIYSLLPPHVKSPKPVRLIVKNQDVDGHVVSVELLDNGNLVYNKSYHLRSNETLQDQLPRKGKTIRIKLDGAVAATKAFGWGWIEMHIIVVNESGTVRIAIGGKVS